MSKGCITQEQLGNIPEYLSYFKLKNSIEDDLGKIHLSFMTLLVLMGDISGYSDFLDIAIKTILPKYYNKLNSGDSIFKIENLVNLIRDVTLNALFGYIKSIYKKSNMTPITSLSNLEASFHTAQQNKNINSSTKRKLILANKQVVDLSSDIIQLSKKIQKSLKSFEDKFPPGKLCIKNNQQLYQENLNYMNDLSKSLNHQIKQFDQIKIDPTFAQTVLLLDNIYNTYIQHRIYQISTNALKCNT